MNSRRANGVAWDLYHSRLDLAQPLTLIKGLRWPGVYLEGAAEGLIPWLGWRDADHFILMVTDIEVEVGEELSFRERVGGIDAEEWMPPWQLDARLATDLDPASDPHPIGDARIATRRQFHVTAPFDLRPHLIAERQPGDLLGPHPRRLIIAIGETKPGTPLRKVVPMMPPWTLQLFVARIRE